MSFDPNAIGNRIFTLRTNAKLSQEKLAEKLGVSHRHLGDLERGSSNGSVKILIDIAEYFHVSMDYLLLGRDPSRDQFQNELQAAIDHLEKIKGLFIITSTRNAPAGFTPTRAFLVLFKNIGKGKQLYFSAFLCLKQAVRKSAFRENVVVVVCSFPKDCCILPNQFQFVQTDFFITVFSYRLFNFQSSSSRQ